MKKIRIARNPVSFPNALMRVNRLMMVFLNIYMKHTRAADRDYITETRTLLIRKNTELAEMRRQKLCNDLVIQDLKIEAMNREAGHPVRPEWTDKLQDMD